MSHNPNSLDGPEEPEVVSDQEWSEQSSSDAGPDDDDPQGMKGQLDDSMNGLESDHDVDEASRGIPQQDG